MDQLIRTLPVEFLYLDLQTCTRCRATDATLREAIELTRPALDAVGVAVAVTKTHVADADQARQAGFVSSPTIRVNGHDIAGELVESACDSCSDGCACGGRIDCRDWVYRGQRTTEPPVGLIVEALVRAASVPASTVPSRTDDPAEDLPENLRRYFAPPAAVEQSSGCCDQPVRDTCCAAEDKATCCGADLESQLCGCQS